jgi:PAS domain S-box-containing protein
MKAPSELPHHSDCEARLIVENMPGFAWSADQDGKLRYLNERFLEYTGKRIEDFNRIEGVASLGRTDVLHPEDVADTVAAVSHSVATGDPYAVEHRVRRFDGTYRWFRASAVRIRDPMSQEIGWYGVDIDIDDQKRTGDALRQSEQSLNHLIETLPAMVWRATPDGEPEYINSRLANYTGRGLDGIGRGPEDLGRTLDDLVKLKVRNAMVHQEDLETAAQAWARALETNALDFTARIRAADGSYRWFQVRAEPMRDEAGRIAHWYGVAVDIDDQKRTEEALRTTQAKLSRASEIATVSELAASIAHEISQPLAALVANGHAIQRWLFAEPPNLERARLTADRLIRDGNAAAEVVNRIRALFKRTDLSRAPLDLNEVIREVNRLMTDEVSVRNVMIETDLADDVPPIWADRVQMQQVIANLARNGVEAMESEESHPKLLTIRSRRDGTNSVLIEIRDQGSGLEDVERVFEPFFTTKETGMGMGLAISRWIVEAHQGRLWATRNDPRGAVFSFTLPISSRAP